MEPLSLVTAVAAIAGTVLALLNIREKLWPTPPKPHPLAQTLHEIAAAIRDLKPLR